MSGDLNPVVKMTKLSKNFVDLHLEEKLKKDTKKIFENITANHLSYLPRLQCAEINEDFPTDLPDYLMWPAKSLFPVEKKPAIKQEVLAKVEAIEFTEHTPRERRRRPRYTGTYNVESLTASTLKAAEEQQQNQQPRRKKNNSVSSETSNMSKASTSKVVTEQPRPSTRKKTISESSASSSHLESSASVACSTISSVAPLKMKITARRIQSISSSSSCYGSPVKNSPLKGFKPNGEPVHATSSSSSSSSSGSSSDSSDEEITKKKKKKDNKKSSPTKPTVLKESKLMRHSRKQALNTPKVNNPNPKPFVKEAANKPVQKEELKGVDAPTSEVMTETPVVSKSLEKPPVMGKSPEKPPIIKPQLKKFEKPKIVEAPKMDPKTNKPITREALDKQKLKKIPRIPKKKPENPLEKLGGIFTVANGWEKTEESAKTKEKPKAVSPVAIEPGTIHTPPLPVIGPSLPEVGQISSVTGPSTTVGNVNRKPRSPIRAPTSSISFVKAGEMEMAEKSTTKFDRHRDFDDSSSDEEMPEVPAKASSSSSSSSESENEEMPAEAPELEASKPEASEASKPEAPQASKPEASKAAAPEAQETEAKKSASEDSSSSSSDEEEKKESDEEGSPKRAAASDLEDILLVDDIELDYEDDDDRDLDFQPPKYLAPKTAPKIAPKVAAPVVPEENYTAELDELKLTLRKEEIVPITAPKNTITAPKEDPMSDFDRNTEEIMAKIAPPVDTATRRVIQQFFGNICTDFLDDKCPLEASSCKHFLPEPLIVAQKLDRCALTVVDDGFNVAIQFPKLLMAYFGQFAEQFVKKAFMQTHDEARLARMILECEKNARTHALYRTIAAALSNVAKMPPYKATKFIIKYHTDSVYARDIIVQMILSTGPDLIRNIDYLQGIAATQTMPVSFVDKILANCITYQDPALPNLCLDLLMNFNPKQINELSGAGVTKFINLQLELTSKNDEREQKAAHLAIIASQKPKQRPPPNV